MSIQTEFEHRPIAKMAAVCFQGVGIGFTLTAIGKHDIHQVVLALILFVLATILRELIDLSDRSFSTTTIVVNGETIVEKGKIK